MVTIPLGAGTECDFLQAGPKLGASSHPSIPGIFFNKPENLIFRFIIFFRPLGVSFVGAGIPVYLASCSIADAGHIGDAQHALADAQEHPMLQESESRTSRVRDLPKPVQPIEVHTGVRSRAAPNSVA